MHCDPGLMFILNIIFICLTLTQCQTSGPNSSASPDISSTISSETDTSVPNSSASSVITSSPAPETDTSGPNSSASSVITSSAAPETVPTSANNMENGNNSAGEGSNGIKIYYPRTLHGTVYRILIEFNIDINDDTLELITLLVSKNISTYTVGRGMLALINEMDARYRGAYIHQVIPRVCGLHRKMNTLVAALPAIYGFEGAIAVKYGKLIRSMPLHTIIGSALEGARAAKDANQYNKLLALAKKIEKMDGNNAENLYSRYSAY